MSITVQFRALPAYNCNARSVPESSIIGLFEPREVEVKLFINNNMSLTG
jgi:hypothetical protein